MTYRSKVTALSVTLGILVAVYALGSFFSPEAVASRRQAKALLTGKATEAVSLSLAGPGAVPVELVKDQGQWVLLDGQSRLPVVQAKVEAFLEALAGVKRLVPRSESGSSLAGFGLDGTKAVRVTVKAAGAKTLADFNLGGTGPTGKEVYLRLGTGATVYAADAGMASYVATDRASWLDLRVFGAPPKAEEVQTLAASGGLSLDGKKPTVVSYNATRKDGGWTSPSGSLEAVSVESILRSALNLSGEDLVALPPPTAFGRVQARVELGLASGKKLSLEVGAAADEGRFYLRSSASPWVYLVSSYSLGALLRSPQAGK